MTDKSKTFDRANIFSAFASMQEGNGFSTSAVDKNIGWIASTGKKMDCMIHATAVVCIYLSMPHKDGGHNCANRALKLVNAMPKGSRVKALVAWFHAYSNIRLRWDKKAGAYTAGVLKPSAKDYKPADPQTAMSKPFWSVEEKDVDPSEFTTDTLAKRVAALLKAASAANAKLDAKGKAALADLQAAALKMGKVEA